MFGGEGVVTGLGDGEAVIRLWMRKSFFMCHQPQEARAEQGKPSGFAFQVWQGSHGSGAPRTRIGGDAEDEREKQKHRTEPGA